MEEGHVYRNYDDNLRVDEVYKLNHVCQTVDYVKEMHTEYMKFDKGLINIWDVMNKLDQIVDTSDPDTNQVQSVHAFQTAERLRNNYPELDWLHLVGLVHDLGKVLSLPEFGNLPQWAVVGDTYPVGCAFSDTIVKHEYFSDNPDTYNPNYNTRYGIYEHGCGLSNLIFYLGHDEYLYQVLKNAKKQGKCSIPDTGLKIIRYHSFYPWHKEGAYTYLMSDEDQNLLELMKKFSAADLYTKVPKGRESASADSRIKITDGVMNYYKQLVNKYFTNTSLNW